MIAPLVIFFFMLGALATGSPPQGQDEANQACAARKIGMDAPKDRSTVVTRGKVRGKVDAPCARVWVVVHPLEDSRYYVQPKTSVGPDGKWQTLVYYGEFGKHAGQEFEVAAFANPTSDLKEGDALANWPAAEQRTPFATVKKGKDK